MEKDQGEKKILARVKKVVEIKGSLYLCIPRSVVEKCNLAAGEEVAIVAQRSMLMVVLPDKTTPRT